MRTLFPITLLCCAACAAPIDGALPGGSTWGAEHYGLTVDADGAAGLEGDCAHGDLGVVDVDEGALTVSFDWISEAGPVQDPPEDADKTPVTLDADVTKTRIEGTLSADDGSWEEAVDLVRDEEPVLYKCQ